MAVEWEGNELSAWGRRGRMWDDSQAAHAENDKVKSWATHIVSGQQAGS